MSSFVFIKGYEKMTINVKTKNSNYDILIENGIFDNLGKILKQKTNGAKVFFVIDEVVFSIYGEKLKKILSNENIKFLYYIMPEGEKSKCEKILFEIFSNLAKEKISRKDYIVAFGGGVCGDLTGFAASSFLRGVNLIQVPTTLLSQVDSSVGGKVAIDLPEGKNLVGAFYPPKLVVIDPYLLKTLPEKTFNCGMAEVIKYGAIYDEKLFEMLNCDISEKLDQVIGICVDIKRKIVENDEFDTGERMILNFGHTYGHIVEKYFNYEKYTHGEAVAIGMAHITKISENEGLTEKGTYNKLVNLLDKYNLLFDIEKISESDGKDVLNLDKKSETDSINYIIIEKIGKSKILKLKKEDNFLWKNWL